MNNQRILVVEDDKELQRALQETIELSGYSCEVSNNPTEAIKLFEREKPNLVILDINLQHDISGIELLEKMKCICYHTPIIIITAYASVESAVLAIKKGASDYLAKPFVANHLIGKIQRYATNDIVECDVPIATCDKMKKLLKVCQRVARSNVTVLLTGESGTGKEVIAKYIHRQSKNESGPWVGVNCAAIPENMLEAILFGHEKGAFTGAHQSMPGKFEQAQEGTILLDEISEMPLSLQVKLLRVIQEKEVERIGSKKAINLNIKIIAATNKDLKKCVQDGTFREDLYFRLSVFPIWLPPLRERQEDIIPLSEFILKKINTDEEKIKQLSDEAKNYLKRKSWQGNVRELENFIQRVWLLTDSSMIELSDIQSGEFIESVDDYDPIDNSLNASLKDKEYDMILHTLENNQGSRIKTAEILGISPRTLRHKLAKMKSQGMTIPKSILSQGA